VFSFIVSVLIVFSSSPVASEARFFDTLSCVSGDHALIDIGKLMGLNPRQLTVRTKSRDAQSADSPPTPIPPSILRGRGHFKVSFLSV